MSTEQASFIKENSNFDFSTVASGTPILVSPKLIDDLSVGGNQRRNNKRSESFTESIRTKGVLQSLSVRPSVDDPMRLELCCGYGRRDAALMLEIDRVPVIVNTFTDKQALSAMLSENRDRQNVTIVDESDLAQKYLSLHTGDVASASIELGLSERVFRERLQLQRLTQSVLTELADEASPLVLGHALVMSTFDEETQENTLKAVLANPKEYSVKELKLRASKRQLPLSDAPFDTTDCQSCQYNTGEQLDLLGDGSADAKCSRPVCFGEKAHSWVHTVRLKELEEKYGTVIAWEVKQESDRNTVSVDTVGTKQFKDGCMNCESKVVIVDDRPMRWGNHIEDQCIDTDCNRKCVSDLKAEKARIKKAESNRKKAQQEAKEATLNTEKTQPSKDSATEKPSVEIDKAITDGIAAQSPSKPKAVKMKTSANALEDYRQQLRLSSAKVATNDPKFRMALALASLCEVSGYKVKVDDDMSHYTLNTKVLSFMKLEMDVIQSEMGKAVIHHAFESEGYGHNQTDLMISVLKERDDAVGIATEAWNPTTERLAMYNINQIKLLCQQSGFSNAYTEDKGVDAYESIYKNNKGDIIKAVMAYDFDWSHFAPTDYLALIK